MEELRNNNMPDVSFATAPVKFQMFEHYKAQAQQIADYINGITLTDDNVKEVKADLASARKIVDGLDRRRIDIRKFILSDYMKFEDQVKELQSIIKDAEGGLRLKLREMEEKERTDKKETVFVIWCKRFQYYRLSEYATPESIFDRWLTPQHLNKSVSMKAVEKDMVEWLEKTDKDMIALDGMDDEYRVEYLGCLDLAQSIEAVDNRNGIREQVEAVESESIPAASFIVKGEKDIKLARMLLKENDIEFEER